MPKVCLYPAPKADSVGGVMSVVRGLAKALKARGWEITPYPDKADIVHVHALGPENAAKVCDVYTNHGYYPEGHPEGEKLTPVIDQFVLGARRVTSVAGWPVGRYADRFGVSPAIIQNGVDLAEIDAAKAMDVRKEFKLDEKWPVAMFAKVDLNYHVCQDGVDKAIEIAWASRRVSFLFCSWPEGRPKPPNVVVVGKLPRARFLSALKGIDVFLSTTLENCPVAVLEAMAASKPVLWADIGGNPELDPAGASFDLASGNWLSDATEGLWRCARDAAKLGAENRKRVADKFTWDVIARQYAKVYEEVIAEKKAEAKGPKASVVVTCHNLKKYVRKSVESALAQRGVAHEVILVDDASTDGSMDEISDLLPKVKLIRHEKNTGVSASRNEGVKAAKGRFVSCLDGDDVMEPTFLAETIPLLEADARAGACSVTWDAVNESDGKASPPMAPIVATLDSLKQANSVMCASLFRKAAWERAGGQKAINPSWEDYDMWLTMAEMGWRFVAHKGKPIVHYTVKANAGRNAESQPQAARLRGVVNAWHPNLYKPKAAVVVPTYTHPELVPVSVGSVLAQTEQEFEVVIVDDGIADEGKAKALADYVAGLGDPRVRLEVHGANRGLSAARNTGMALARADYVVPLDDDDKVAPAFLEKALAAMKAAGGNALVFTDYWQWDGGEGDGTAHGLPEYNFEELMQRDSIPTSPVFPKAMWEKAGRYDEKNRIGLEDWDLWIRLGAAGCCGVHIPEPLFYYRQWPESMRTKMLSDDATLAMAKARVVANNRKLFRGERPMGCCGGGKKAAPLTQDERITLAQAGVGVSDLSKVPAGSDGMVLLRYTGPFESTVTYHPSNISYHVSTTAPLVLVQAKDVNKLLAGAFVMAGGA